MPPKTPKKTPKKPKDTPRKRTRSNTVEDELEHTDDPEKIRDKQKNKKGGKPKEVPKDKTNEDNIVPPDEEVEEVEEEVQEENNEEEPVPNNKDMVLPSGEWCMPDLKNTTMSQVLKDGRDDLGDNTGRILFQFEKLEQYTGYDHYLVCPFSGNIDIYDTVNMTCIPIAIKASKEPKLNSVVKAEVTKASQEHRQRSWENMALSGEDLPVSPVDTPLTTTQLANIMIAFEGLC